MAVAMLFESADGTAEQYDAVVRELGAEVPAGAIFHIAGPMEGGGFRIVEVWESEEASRRFFEERLGAALQRHGVQSSRVATWPVHNMMGAATATL